MAVVLQPLCAGRSGSRFASRRKNAKASALSRTARPSRSPRSAANDSTCGRRVARLRRVVLRLPNHSSWKSVSAIERARLEQDHEKQSDRVKAAAISIRGTAVALAIVSATTGFEESGAAESA